MTNIENDLQHFILPSPVQEVHLDILSQKQLRLFVKREDLIHPWLSGNKYRKLKYNLNEANALNKRTILTFGGAFSNHLYATAGACELFGLKSIGIVRGEIDTENPTLKFCKERGMDLIPVSRSIFRDKSNADEVKDIVLKNPNVYIVPEGGTNYFAIKGVTEMMQELEYQFDTPPDFIVLSCGTGGTTAGLLSSDILKSKIISFSSLKTDYLQEEILKLANYSNKKSLTVNSDYHFGGYAKWDVTLLKFISDFEKETKIPVDHIYNGKALYGLMNLIKNDYFDKGSVLCFIHTGGLQGKNALNYMLKKKGRL